MAKILLRFLGTLLLGVLAAPAMALTIVASPTSCVNDASIGTQAWANPGNAISSNNVYATSSGTNSQISNYLKCTGYNFNLPLNSIVNGITVAVSAYSGKTMNDYAMQLVKGGVIQATNYATLTRLSRNTPAYVIYGSATDLWGNTWTETDINNANFGAVFAVQRGPYNTTDTAYVDHIQITVDYTVPTVPTVTTNAATSITDAVATLNGTVSSNNAATTVTFDYGLTTSYGSTATAAQSPLAATAANTAVSAALTGLACGSTYHFRAKGVNVIGTTNGSDLTFTTSACPTVPAVTTNPATAITNTGATLNGTVSSNGGSTAATFDYGLTTAYGSSATAAQSPLAAGAVNTAVSAAVTGLTCGTTYHFRAKGVNSAGTTNGADSTFATTACSTTTSVTASPTNCTNLTGIGTQVWSNPGNAMVSDNVYASATVNDNQTTNYLQCLTYNFNIPLNATINGIAVNVQRLASSTSAVTDAAMRLVKAGAVQTTDRSTTTYYPTANTYENHGGSTDLWGGTWTPADINNVNFGAAFASKKPVTAGGNRNVNVDHMPITIYYTLPAPSVVSINRAGANPTSAASVSWTVTFDQAVAGVDAADFNLVPSVGVTSSIASVTEAGGTGINTVWTVTATGTGTGTLGLNLIDNDSIVVPSTGLKLGGTGTGNGNFTGQVYDIMANCVGGDFTSPTLDTNLWDVRTIAGAFTPQIIDAGGGDYRLRLTDTGGYEATFAQLKNFFPAYGNKVVLVFDYFSYGGTGADGIAVTFSDATVTSTTGGFGGSLGYAQNGTNLGFGGGWMGIGLDEWGNYPCNNESRTGYPVGWTDPVLGAGAVVCTGSGGGNHYVAIRGSGNGTTGYNLIANTGLIATTAPASGAAGASPYRYRITLDHSDSVHAYVTVERDTTGTGNSYATLVPKFDIKGTNSGQAAVPPNWLVSFTGSTGGSTNNHELKQVHVCANTVAGIALDHLEIEHASGTGVTCSPSTLTIKACSDAATPCTPYTGGVTGTLNASGAATVNWSGGSSFSIPVGFSTVTKDVQVTTPNVPAIFDATPSVAAGTTTCNFGSPSCTFIASDSGFLVSAPDHVSETTSALTVKAVKKADNSLMCVPAFASTTKTVNLQCAYGNPTTGTLPVRVGGIALNAGQNTAAACDGTGANVSLAFDATGVATPTLQYADVGQMNITASHTGTPGAVDAGLSMTGTGSFKTAPASFSFSGISAGPIKAGGAFTASVSALNSAGTVTPNFGKESPAEGVTLTSTLVTPNPVTYPTAVNPAIGNNAIPGSEFGAGGMVSDANGVATVNNLSWGEVGDITLTATLTSASYLGSGLTASGTSATVGRFIPDHFDTTVSQVSGVPMPCPNGLSCPTQYNGFVYAGQSFTTNIYALNAAGGTTQNYDSTFGLAKQVILSAWDAQGSTATQNPPAVGSGALNNNSVPAASFKNGTTALGTAATPDYTFNTVPTAPTDIYLRATDSDNVTSLRSTPSTSVEGGVKVASGRIKMSNAHGSELLSLPIAITAQYWNATSGWVTSSTDSVSSIATSNLSYTNCQKLSTASGWPTTCPPPTTASPASVVLIGGTGSFTLSAPGTNNTGSVDMSLSVPGYLSSNTARATFGVYKSNSDFIYLRETY
ncbi:MAG: hypothetical protein GC139_09915 [Sideroxydans sp.]|nr:hypothetical protein [Sideroxydans sp.]